MTTKPQLSGRNVTTDASSPSPLPIIGKIKTGIKVTSQSGKEIPQSTDYFVCSGNYAAAFHKVYGPKPTALEVTFVSDELSQSCFERFECRNEQGRLTGYSDGETTYLWDGIVKAYRKNDDKEMMKAAGKWKHQLTIRFLLPKITGVFGVWEYTTGGEMSSIPAIRDTFDFVQSKTGTVVGIPFDLQVKKVKSQRPGESSLFPVVNLVPNLSAESLETVRLWIESGKVVTGMLTEGDIKKMKELPPASNEE